MATSNAGMRVNLSTGNITTNVLIATGNVGVGTTTPTQTIDIQGTIKALAFVGDGSQLTNFVGGVQGLPTQWTTTQTGCNIYYSLGNVGVGTVPSVPIHAKGAILSQLNGVHSQGESFGLHSIMAYAPGGASANSSIWMGFDPTSDCGYINAARSGQYRPVCIQTRGGSVGIGTTNPQATLHIEGDIYATGNMIGKGIYIELRRATGQTFAANSYTNYSWSSSSFSNGITLVGGSGINITFSYTGVYFFTCGLRTGPNTGDVWNASGIRSTDGTVYGYSYGSGNFGTNDPNGITYTWMANIPNTALSYQVFMYRANGSCTTDTPNTPFPSINCTIFRIG